MIALRYKPLASGRYSLYLDCYNETKKKRKYEFLKLYTTHDYSKTDKILAKDKPILEQAHEVMQQRTVELFPGHKEKTSISTIVDFIKTNPEHETYNSFKSIVKHLSVFESNYPMPLTEITIEWVQQIEGYLGTILKDTTVDLLMARIKKYFEKAKEKNLIENNPFDGYKLKNRKNDSLVYLDKAEIKALKEAPVTFNPQIVDAFFLSLETGLQWMHIKNLQHNQFEYDKSRDKVNITLNHQRTTDAYTVVFSREARRILNKYNGTGLVFDKLPNKPNCNIKLHLWGAMAGIDKTLCFSLARNTYIMSRFKPDKLLKDVMAESGIKRHGTLKKYNKIYRNNGNIAV